MADWRELSNFNPSGAAGLFFPTARIVVCQTGPQVIVPSDPCRIILAIWIPASTIPASNQRVSYRNEGSGTVPWPITGTPEKWKYADWGALCGYEWYGYADSYPASFAYWEETYRVNTRQETRDEVLQGGFIGRYHQPDAHLEEKHCTNWLRRFIAGC